MTLPKFLLAWSDFNWLWCYAKLRPARNEDWSIFRTLGLTAIAAVVGATLGLLIGLVFFGQPVGWLPWLLGLWNGCVGLCWFGVTGLCWNQRAASLRAQPELAIDLPKARHPFFRWCLGFVYFLVLGVLTPFALLVTVENIRGEITWKREHARLIAAGEKLTARAILGPVIPAEQNAGAAEVFAPFFDYHYGKPALVGESEGAGIYSSGLFWPQSNRLAHLETVLEIPSNYLPEESKKGSRQHPATPMIDIADWSAAYRSAVEHPKRDDAAWAAEIKLPPPGNPSRDVLAGLAIADKELAEICVAAALPRSQFPLHYEDAWNTLLRHVAQIKRAQSMLQLRCVAHLAGGDNNAAFTDVTNALNVANLLREEPLLISQLVRYAQINIAVNTIWQGLAGHAWSDAQLAEFQARLLKSDCITSLVLAMEGERALASSSLDRAMGDARAYDDLFGAPPGHIGFLRNISRSVVRQNQTTLIHIESEALTHLRIAISNAPRAGLLTAVRDPESKLEHYIGGSPSPYNIMLRQLAPATGTAIEKTARAETVVQLAIVACALERYRLAHGQFPDRLNQLTPEFGAPIPNDPMVNEPFHYSRTDDGWFLLYSVGLNGTDDGGLIAPGMHTEKEPKDWAWPVPTRPEHPRLF